MTVIEGRGQAWVLRRARRTRASSVKSPRHARAAGARVFPAFTFGRTSPVPTRSSPLGSWMRRRPSGPTCAMRWPSVTPRRPPPLDRRRSSFWAAPWALALGKPKARRRIFGSRWRPRLAAEATTL